MSEIGRPPEWAEFMDEPYPLDHTITWREHYARKASLDQDSPYRRRIKALALDEMGDA